MGIHRNLLIRMIAHDHSTKGILLDWDGTTEEAIKMLLDGPEFLVGECDNKNPDGSCAGHPLITSQT
jgi:hypothetical protein